MRPSRLPVAAAAGLLVLIALAMPASAADPSGKPPAAAEPADPKTEVWQDTPLPTDAPVGHTATVGFTIWNVVDGTFSRANSATVLVHPKTGKAAPTQATTQPDWPGHVIAYMTVPRSGIGKIEVGFEGQVCHDDGTCTAGFFPFTWGGIGPPREAPRSLLVDAVIHPPSEPFVPGTPFAVTADVRPRAEWDPAVLALPTDLEVIARTAGGVDLASAQLQRAPGPAAGTASYSGAIDIPPTNDLTLVLAFPPGASHPREVIDRSVVRIPTTSRGGGGSASPIPSAGAGANGPVSTSVPVDVPILPIGLGAAAIVVGLIVRRVFADL